MTERLDSAGKDLGVEAFGLFATYWWRVGKLAEAERTHKEVVSVLNVETARGLAEQIEQWELKVDAALWRALQHYKANGAAYQEMAIEEAEAAGHDMHEFPPNRGGHVGLILADMPRPESEPDPAA